MSTQTASFIALAVIVIAVPVLIIWKRMRTKPMRDKLREQWNAAPKVHVRPTHVAKPEPVLIALQTDPTHCPFCRGEIELGVLKCKHCGEWLNADKRKEQEGFKAAQLETAKSTKSTNQAIAWVFFLLFGIPGLVAIFRNC